MDDQVVINRYYWRREGLDVERSLTSVFYEKSVDCEWSCVCVCVCVCGREGRSGCMCVCVCLPLPSNQMLIAGYEMGGGDHEVHQR